MDFIVLEEILSATGPLAGEKVTEINSISGGCIHNAWQLKLATGQKLFAKTSSIENFPMLDFESKGLTELNKIINQDYLIVPKPLFTKKLSMAAVLIMPWLELSEGNETNLGRGLALLHQSSVNETQGHFGWREDGFIGYSQQIGGWKTSWGECFMKLRLMPQFKMAKAWGLDFSLQKFSTRLIKYLDIHNPIPSLVHGDLWRGNASVHKKGKGVIYDPAIWRADREVDIAMTKLFGGFSQDFYSAYEEIWELPKSYKERIDIYNLYHLLNHANLFGGNYRHQSLSLLKKIDFFLEKF